MCVCRGEGVFARLCAISVANVIVKAAPPQPFHCQEAWLSFPSMLKYLSRLLAPFIFPLANVGLIKEGARLE